MSSFMGSKIALIGYRATGKSTLAKLLAERLHYSMVDSDLVIEAQAGRSIAQIFSESGESEFRRLEEIVIADILQGRENVVLATGGGAPISMRTRERLRAFSTVFWLQAPPKTIYERMYGDVTTATRRPALTDLDPYGEIENVLKRREDFYRESAHFLIDTEKGTLEQIAQKIIDLYEENL